MMNKSDANPIKSCEKFRLKMKVRTEEIIH